MSLNAGGYVSGTYRSTGLVHVTLDWVLWITRGLNDAPTVRGTDVTVPAKAGRLVRNRVADVLVIEMQGYVLAHGATVADTVANYRASVEALRALFDPTLTPGELELTLEDGGTGLINARTLDLNMTERVPSHVAEVRVQLESVDPTWVITPGGS